MDKKVYNKIKLQYIKENDIKRDCSSMITNQEQSPLLSVPIFYFPSPLSMILIFFLFCQYRDKRNSFV